MRKSQHLITREVDAYMALYEVEVSARLQCMMSLNLHYRAIQTQNQYDRLYIAWSSGMTRGNQLQSKYQVYLLPSCVRSIYASLGPTIISAYTLAFQTHIFSVLPPSFARGIKALVSATLQRIICQSQDPQDRVLWQAFDTLNLIDRYESLIASIGYEIIESHVMETCAGEWTEPMLGTLRAWMVDNIVPWMLHPFARGATNGDSLLVMQFPAADFTLSG
jgi:anaphase-promoting complex subunit 2